MSQVNDQGEYEFLTPCQFERKIQAFRDQENQSGAKYWELSSETARRYYKEYVTHPLALTVYTVAQVQPARRIPVEVEIDVELYDAPKKQCEKTNTHTAEFIRQLIKESIDSAAEIESGASSHELLASYFLEDVFVSHPKAYKKKMRIEDFAYALETFRDRLNEQNGCFFRPLSQELVRQFFDTYQARMECVITQNLIRSLPHYLNSA